MYEETDTSDKWYEDISGELFEEKRRLVLSACYGGGNGRLLVIAEYEEFVTLFATS